MSNTRAKRDIDFNVAAPETPDPITLSRVWLESNGTVGTFSNPTTVDTDKLGVIIVNQEDSGGATQISSVSVSGQFATPVISSFEQTTFSNESSLFYFTEAQLQLISDGDPIIVTWTNGSPTAETVYSAIFKNVSQVNPIVSSIEFSTTGGSGLLSSPSVTGGYSVVVVNSGLQTSANITQNNLDFNEVFNSVTLASFTSALYVKANTDSGTTSTQWNATALRLVSFMVNFRRS